MGGLHSKIDYKVFVYTGDKPFSGSDANVSMVIYDDEGTASETIVLDNKFTDDFERGQVDVFDIYRKQLGGVNRHGKVSQISLWRDSAGLGSGWYVDKIVVENRRTNTSFVFPIFRWIKSDYKYQVKHLDTALPQNEEFKEQRNMELEEKRKEYVFDQKVADGPAQVKSMPSDEKFSFDYKWDIVRLKAKLIATSFLVKIMASGEFDSFATLTNVYTQSTLPKPKWDIVKTKAKLIVTSKLVMLVRGEWASINDIASVYTRKVFNKPAGADRWSNDIYFGLQRVASLNHSLIHLVTAIPEKLPVTDELLGSLLEGLTLSEAVEQKRLFICDLKILEGVTCREPYVMCVPIALFFVNNNHKLLPIAIQLFQEPGPDNPIFTPLDPSLMWAYVKMWYNNADAAYHQALTHLGLTHLLMEGVTIATHRNLSQSHPIFKLLAPHFLYLIAINSRGLELLVAEGGWVDKVMNVGSKGLFCLISKGLNSWRMDTDGTLPEDLKRRGLDDPKVLPCYHYRDDALLLYTAIKKYVRGYVDLYYPTRDLIKGDTEIQTWAAELVKDRNYSSGGVGVRGVPGNGEITCSEDLVIILSCIIYTCSISHASTNFPQYEEYAFPPNYPSLMRGRPPTSKDMEVKEKDILSSLPDKPTTLDIMTVTKILSEKGTKSIGDFEVQYIFDPQAREIVDQFRRDLREISKTIKERNQHRDPPYEYLDPEIIPNSISI